jgi:hypothetical protein
MGVVGDAADDGARVTHTPVCVVWQDAHALSSSWITVDEIEAKPRTITTVGYVIQGAKHRHLVIAQSVDGDNLDHVLAIPLGMIRRVDVLAPAGTLPLQPSP